jgi:hypothetical protein
MRPVGRCSNCCWPASGFVAAVLPSCVIAFWKKMVLLPAAWQRAWGCVELGVSLCVVWLELGPVLVDVGGRGLIRRTCPREAMPASLLLRFHREAVWRQQGLV